MVDFNGFDKGVIGKKLPADTTLNCMRKADLIKLLHLAEDNHRVLAEAYKIAVDNSKCKTCPLHLDTRRVDAIRADAVDECKRLVKARIQNNLGLANATKYGNKNAKQQANSYASVMKYEIADCVEDLLDDLGQLKEKK